MSVDIFERRLTAVENELARLREQIERTTTSPNVPWWDRIYGTFADSEDYAEAMRLGREYRLSQRPDPRST